MGQIVKFVELVHDYILSKQQRIEMNRRYCDAMIVRLSLMRKTIIIS